MYKLYYYRNLIQYYSKLPYEPMFQGAYRQILSHIAV